VIKLIREGGFLLPPSKGYNLSHPNDDPSIGQSTVVKLILENMVRTRSSNVNHEKMKHFFNSGKDFSSNAEPSMEKLVQTRWIWNSDSAGQDC